MELLEVKNLKRYFQIEKGQILKAVDDISFKIKEGETLGLVGESGCGKTTCGRTLAGIYNPTDGEVIYKGKAIHKMKGRDRRELSKEIQVIFQDPYASLDPRMTVGDIVAEGIDIHNLCESEEERTSKIQELLRLVGLNEEHANRFVHEFSGGQRQRVGIARALAVNPKFIICDEPLSALDVSIQAQIVNLLIEIQKKLGISYLFIAHDLSLVKHISDRVAVMYLGQIVEIAPSKELYEKTMHPYTKALMSAIPIADPDIELERRRIFLQGDVPSPINPEVGCRFKGRCKYAKEECVKVTPELRELREGHYVACHLFK